MSTKEIKSLLENGQTNQVAERFQINALPALGEILAKEKSIDIQNNALIAYQLIANISGPLSRKEITPFIDPLGSGKINPNCRDEIVKTMNQLGDLAIAQLLDYSLKASENLKLFFYDVLNDIDEKVIIETLLAEKITSPGKALAYEILVRINDKRFLDNDITVYDSSLDYTFDLPIIREAILSGLNSSDLEVNIRTVQISSKYASISTEVVPKLVNYLDSSSDTNLVVETLKTLGSIGSENAVDAINKKISPDNPRNIRLAAIGAIGAVKTDSSKAIGILIKETLYDKDDDVRFKTINALGKIGEPAAPVLVDLLQNEENIDQIEIALKRVGESAVPYLLEALTNKKTRKNAIDLTKLILTPKYGFQGTVSKLIEFLGDKSPEIQEEVINTIIEMGDPGLESVIRVLNSENAKVRANTREILSRFGLMNIHLYIENMVKDPKKLVQSAELLVLLAIYQPDDDLKAFSFEQFDILLENQDYNEHVQQAVFDNILGNVSTDSDPDIRFAFGQVAYYLGYPALSHLLRMLNDKDDGVVEVALDSIGLLKRPNESLSEIAKKLKSKSSNVRLAAINALGNLESNECIPYLIEGLGDEDVEIQDAASSAINQIGDVGLPALINAMDHKEPRMRDRVASLIASYNERAWEPLLDRLNTNNNNFQETAIEVIGLLGESFAERLLTFVQTSLDENIQCVSIQGLGKLEYQPALDFIANSIQTNNKKIIQAISSAHKYFKEDLTNAVLFDLEKSSGNAEKVLVDYLQKDSDPRWTVIPIIQQLSKKTPKAVIYIDLLKKYGDKYITESLMNLLQNNQLETVDELLTVLQQFQDLNKLVEKVSVNIPK